MARLTFERLLSCMESGTIEHLVVAYVDSHGRLRGKYVTAGTASAEVLAEGAEVRSYVLTADHRGNPAASFPLARRAGVGRDFSLRLDEASLMYAPWLGKAAIVIGDPFWLNEDHTVRETPAPVEESPRYVLRRQIELLAQRGLAARIGTEIQFSLAPIQQAAAQPRRETRTSECERGSDYGLALDDSESGFVFTLRDHLREAGVSVEDVKRETGEARFEFAILARDAMTAADQIAVFKTAARQIAATHDRSVNFMARPNDVTDNSCNFHLSLFRADGSCAFAPGESDPPLLSHFIAGVIATLPELTVFYGSRMNSFKRLRGHLGWGWDNRACILRGVGHATGTWLENRMAGADLNPYLAFAAMLAGGMHGLENQLASPTPNQHDTDLTGVTAIPLTLSGARDEFARSAVAHASFGADVVNHYAHLADLELVTWRQHVTEWEQLQGADT